jgi:D-sedoheptulose 7-phosphate isomerase
MTMTNPTEILANLEAAANNVRAACTPDYAAQVAKTADVIIQTFRNGRKLLVFGNGGSAADAMHIAAELVGRFLLKRDGLPVIALGTNPSVYTAWTNDCSFDALFERELQALGQPGDAVWAISTSGNSENVIRACSYARCNGIQTIGMTGRGGGRLAEFSDILLAAPASETPRIQEIHLLTYHTICEIVERQLSA